ncbi:MAG: nicotinate (nicotinamide) nucleotide adenylyltransferase [Alicyclobacillaceae bacterium]|nr:nicotinate (nicotinamide) nucleotide adenylyltransferase [Alicyclobacillaceae bacterium]
MVYWGRDGQVYVILFGGTFDPPHLGHLMMAQLALEQEQADEVWFLPAPAPPHKPGVALASYRARVRMVEALIQGHPRMRVSALEAELPKPSYTVDTVNECRRRFSGVRFAFLLGSDSLAQLPNWHRAQELAASIEFLVAVRSTHPFAAAVASVRRQLPALQARPVEMPLLDVSSSWVRDRLVRGRPVCGLVPHEVLEVWKKMNSDVNREMCAERSDRRGVEVRGADVRETDVRDRVRAQMSAERFRHTEGVVEAASELARRFGADVGKARLAAWVHDAAREWPLKELLEWAGRAAVPEGFDAVPVLLHGPVAAAVLQEWFGVTDPDVLDAVRYHTTGRPGMSLLERILFVADASEPGRSYPGVDDIRAAAGRDLDEALALALDASLRYLLERRLPIFPLTVLARNDAWNAVKGRHAHGSSD